MIPKKPALAKARVDTGFRKRSCSNNKLERDDDSKESHLALGHLGSGSERHSDHRSAAEHQIDADDQSERPAEAARQPSQDHEGEKQIDDPAREHPAPPSGQLASVVER